MNVKITTFTSPFSFFCLLDDLSTEEYNYIGSVDKSCTPKACDVNHGQYLAVLWKDKWTRGIVNMESQFKIWLVDYGIFLRPTDKTVYMNLPLVYKNNPSKVFEVSIHGVVPLNKVLSEDCKIKNQQSTSFDIGAAELAKSLIQQAEETYLIPIALLTTKHNDVVLGDIYFKIPHKGIVNLADELEAWPVFEEKNKSEYIANLSSYYYNRRSHRVCKKKPELPGIELPIMTVETTLEEYNAICARAPEFEIECNYEESIDGSTVIDSHYNFKKEKQVYTLTPEEINKYSKMTIKIHDQEYNVLTLLRNKIRDLNICERYKNYGNNRIGRANSRYVVDSANDISLSELSD